jgi:hypothetical protein
VLRIFLDEVECCLREHSAGSGDMARSGAVAFIHRFGSSLNEHVHFHCCVIDGVFEPAESGESGDIDAAPGVVFHAAAGLDEAAIAAVQAWVRRRLLRTFVRRGLIGKYDAAEMAGWEHGGGFSVDAAVRIEGRQRPGGTGAAAALLRPSALRPGILAATGWRAGTQCATAYGGDSAGPCRRPASADFCGKRR